MTPERWEQVTKIYHSALEVAADERECFVRNACAEDESLCREVESLLEANYKAGDLFTEPAIKNFATLLTESHAAPLTGRTLGHYRIDSLIGVGGMGEVYLAKDLRLDRLVALKTLPATFSIHRNYLRRFKTEVKAAAALNHPNVATIYSVEEVEGQSFFTMEYVEGKTLNAHIPENGLDLNTFLEWFVQISDALSHAHENGIVHRDIKPGNVMITSEGVPKILDFGLAQIDKELTGEFNSSLDKTIPGQILGTPSYMSPEQAEGKSIDHCSDIFSFGVVMYEALTGERPFKGDSYASVVSELLTKEPPPANEIKPEIPFLLARLISRCMSKEVRKRFGSMREVRAILEEIRAAVEAAISLKNRSPWISSGPERRSSARLWLPVVGVIAVILASTVFLLTSSPKTSIDFHDFVLRKLSQTNNVVYAHVTPNGSSVAYNTIEEGERRALWIRQIADKNPLQLLPPKPVFFWGGLTVSGDGGQIFYITAERGARHGSLYRISALGGTPRKLVDNVNDLGSLSPDGERILYVRYGDQVQLLSAKAFGGSDEVLIRSGTDKQLFRDPHFSQDGKSIFFIKFERVGGEEFWSLVEIPVAGGPERLILPARKPRISELAVLRDGHGLLINALEPKTNLQQLFHVSLIDGKETRITNDLNSYFGISVSDDGKTIVTAQRSSYRNIWVASGKRYSSWSKLTNESNVYTTVAWTPDGRLVYDVMDNDQAHIWIMDGDGRNPQQLSPNSSSDFEPRVSPDGRFIIFTSERTGERRIWRMNFDGSNPQLLTPVTGVASDAAIDPDGESVYFSWWRDGGKVLGKVPLVGGNIAEYQLFGDSLWSISPDGERVAYVSYDERSGRRNVVVRSILNNEPPMILNISPINFLLWSWDGQALIYRDLGSDPESDSNVWLQPMAGGEPKLFLSSRPDSVYKLSLFNDGKKIAVVRERFISDAILLVDTAQE